MTWTLFGRQTRNPLAIAVIIVLCLLFLPATLVPHLVMRLFGGEGFLKGEAGLFTRRMYEPGEPWTIASNVVLYVLIFLVIL